MHGNTSWSHLYRKMIPLLVKAGYRCFVPDLMGFGLSDTPEDESAHSLQQHVSLMSGLIQQLGLRDMLVVGQDRGGPIRSWSSAAYRSRLSARTVKWRGNRMRAQDRPGAEPGSDRFGLSRYSCL